MITLAIEQSTEVCSATLMRGSDVIADNKWEDTRLRNQQIFSVLAEMFNKTSVTPSQIDTFTAGLGPGSFSGLRCALATLHGLAMPGRKTLFGITSTEALAWQVMKETGHNSVMILGDARRSSIWYACYEKAGELPRITVPMSLVPVEQLSSIVKNVNVAVTSHWERIGTILEKAASGEVDLIKERRTPEARTIGELTLKRIALGLPSEPLIPIYLHPAVSIKSNA